MLLEEGVEVAEQGHGSESSRSARPVLPRAALARPPRPHMRPRRPAHKLLPGLDRFTGRSRDGRRTPTGAIARQAPRDTLCALRQADARTDLLQDRAMLP